MRQITNLPLKIVLVLATLILTYALITYAIQRSSTLGGSKVPISEYLALAQKYEQEINARRDEIVLAIELPKSEYTSDERIDFSVTLMNRSSRDTTIRRPDTPSNAIRVNFDTDDELAFMITPSDSSLVLNFPMPIGLQPGPPVISSDEFALLHSGENYGAAITLPYPLSPMPEGQYSVYLKYRNYHFGVGDPENPEKFIDYHAWMGEIESNSVNFSIIPTNK